MTASQWAVLIPAVVSALGALAAWANNQIAKSHAGRAANAADRAEQAAPPPPGDDTARPPY